MSLVRVEGAKALSEQLEQLQLIIRRKMTRMVERFVAETIVRIAVSNTPVGDSDENLEYYIRRQKLTPEGFEPVEGYARGGWRVYIDGVGSDSLFSDPTGSIVESDAEERMSDFRLGDTVRVANITSYVSKANVMGPSLESQNEGIFEPTKTAIFAAYIQDLRTYYGEGEK